MKALASRLRSEKSINAHRQSRHRRLRPRTAPGGRRARRRRARRALRRQRRSAGPRARARGRRPRSRPCSWSSRRPSPRRRRMANAARREALGRRRALHRRHRQRRRRRRSFGARDVLPMWDWVGGRFSVWSAVGFAATVRDRRRGFDEFLARRRAKSTSISPQAPLEKNVPVLMALLGVWNINFLGATTHAVLPYAHALRLLPAYLQQLEMESNGKRVDREGRAVDYATAPVVWGAEGTVEPAFVPPAAAPGHAGGAGRLHRRSDAERRAARAPTRARRPTRSPSAPTTRRCRRTGSTRATGRRAC